MAERRSTFDRLDDLLLVGVAIVAAIVVLRLLRWIVGTVFFVLQVGALALVVLVLLRLFSRRRS